MRFSILSSLLCLAVGLIAALPTSDKDSTDVVKVQYNDQQIELKILVPGYISRSPARYGTKFIEMTDINRVHIIDGPDGVMCQFLTKTEDGRLYSLGLIVKDRFTFSDQPPFIGVVAVKCFVFYEEESLPSSYTNIGPIAYPEYGLDISPRVGQDTARGDSSSNLGEPSPPSDGSVPSPSNFN